MCNKEFNDSNYGGHKKMFCSKDCKKLFDASLYAVSRKMLQDGLIPKSIIMAASKRLAVFKPQIKGKK